MSKEKLNEEIEKKKQAEFYARQEFIQNSILTNNILGNSSFNTNKKTSLKKIRNLIKQPFKNYLKLQELSQLLISLNGIYFRLIRYFSSLLTYDHYIFPKEIKTKNKNKLLKEYKLLAQYLDKLNLKTNLPHFAFKMFLNGEIFVYKLEDKNGIVFLEIPNNMCKITLNENNVFRYAIDVSKINEDNLNNFPKEFQKYYNDYKLYKNKKNKKSVEDMSWYQVSDKGIAFPIIPNVEHCYPPFCFLFPDIIDIDNIKDLKKSIDKLDNSKIIHLKIPTDKNTGEPLMEWDLVNKFNRTLEKKLPEGVSSITNPFDSKNLNVTGNQGKITNMVKDCTNEVFADAGVSDLLFANEKASAEALKKSIQADVNLLFSICIPLFNNFINYELSKIKGCNNKWSCNILDSSYFDRIEKHDKAKEDLGFGGSRFLFLATNGITPIETFNMLQAEQMLEIDDLLTVKQTSFTMSDKNTVGKPKKKDSEEIKDSTEKSRELE